MTGTPAPSSLQLPEWTRHEDGDVELVLVAAFLSNEFGLDGPSLADRVVGSLPDTVAATSIAYVAAELELASAVEACTMRSEFEELTGVHSRSASFIEDVEAHAETVRADAAMAASQLVESARQARMAGVS